MTDSITICGFSDDTICFAGTFAEEVTDASMWRGATIEVGDGTVLTAVYAGTWQIERTQEGAARMWHEPAVGEDDPNYSDRVTLTGDLHWVRVVRDGDPVGEFEL